MIEVTATLVAKNRLGKLKWSTGATTSTITVKEKGTYSLVQIVNNEKSAPQTIHIASIKPEVPKVILAKPLEDGSQIELYAELSDGSTAHWYADKELTEEVTSLVPASEEAVFYLVVESVAGCRGEPIPLINGDGINDTWELTNLLDYCKKCQKVAKVSLFNRGGMKVYEKSGNLWLDEPFKGYSDNNLTYQKGYSDNNLTYQEDELLPTGTYFYMIKVAGEDYKVGYIYLTHENR